MKKLLLLPLLLSLSACVTYYYPEGVEESSAYYIEDAPGYVTNLSSNPDYYPWASLDTFYLGSGYYSGYGYGGGGLSFGVSIGYSPWYYPYDSYYSPWYGSYYSHNYQPYYPYYYRPHYSGWWPHQGYCERTHACDRRGNRHHHDDNGYGRDNGQGRFAGVDGSDRHPRGGDDEDGNEDPGGRHDGSGGRSGGRSGDRGEAPVRRYVSTAPSGSDGNRGLVVRNRGNSKPGKSRLEPVHTTSGQTVSAPVTTRQPQRRPVTSIDRSRRGSGEVRYRSGAKPSRARIEPVKPYVPSTNVTTRRSGRAASSIDRSRRSAGEVRYRGGAKTGRSRIEPVKSTIPSSNITTGKKASTRPTRSPSRAVAHRPPDTANKAHANKSGRSYSHTKSSTIKQSRRPSRVDNHHHR